MLPTLFMIVNSVVKPELGATMLNNIVDNYEQYGEQDIVQSCFYQPCNQLMIVCSVRPNYNYAYVTSIKKTKHRVPGLPMMQPVLFTRNVTFRSGYIFI